MKCIYNILSSLIISVVCFSNSSLANKVGNGGDGVFCIQEGNRNKKNNVKENHSGAQLLDFYENNFQVDSAKTDYKDIVLQQLSKIKTLAPKLFEQYSQRIKTIYDEIDYKTEIALTDVSDSNHAFLPQSKNCTLLQVAIRKNVVQPGEKRFIIRKDLWDQFNAINKAGLIWHEIIYEHFVLLGKTDSQKARKLNAFLFSKDFTAQEFWSFIKNLQVAIYP